MMERIGYINEAVGLVFLVFDSSGANHTNKEYRVSASRVRAVKEGAMEVGDEVLVRRGGSEEGSWWPASIISPNAVGPSYDVIYSKPPPGPHPIIYMDTTTPPLPPPPPPSPRDSTPRSVALAPIYLDSWEHRPTALWPVRILSEEELDQKGLSVGTIDTFVPLPLPLPLRRSAVPVSEAYTDSIIPPPPRLRCCVLNTTYHHDI